jgi:hypothetical protein
MELFINGDMVAEFTEKEFSQSSCVGMFVRDTGYRLLVDDLFISSEK